MELVPRRSVDTTTKVKTIELKISYIRSSFSLDHLPEVFKIVNPKVI